MNSRTRLLVTTATAMLLGFVIPGVRADVIVNDPSNVTFRAGIAPLGNLPDPTTFRGLNRLAGNYDPVVQGTIREAWGVSAGSVGGFVDADLGVFNVPGVRGGTYQIVANGAPVYSGGPPFTQAFISTFLNAGAGNLLQIDQTFRFVATNVLGINVEITNVSGVNQNVLYRRLVDWDIAPTNFEEITTADALGGNVTSATFGGTGTLPPDSLTDPANPTLPFDHPTPAGGGTRGEPSGADLGGGVTVNLGSLAGVDNPLTSIDERFTSFNFFYALNLVGQTEDEVRDQLRALGAGFVETTINSESDSGPAGLNVAAIGVQFGTIPEPTTLALLGVGLAGAAGWRRWRRATK